MRISGRERRVLKLGIAFAAILLLYLLAIEPVVEGERQVRKQLEAKTLLLGKSQRVLSRRQSVEEDRDRGKSQLAALEGRLLGGDKPPLAAAELQQILKAAAAKAEVNITSERILDPLVKGHYLEIPVEINVKCMVTQLTLLLFEIENSSRYLSIKEMNIRSDNPVTPKEVAAKLIVSGLIKNHEAM